MLICTPVKRNAAENTGNTGTVIRYNISRNDHTRTFNLSGADRTLVEDNAIYTAARDDVQILLVSNWDGWSKDAVFRNNTFDVAGTAHYGHELHRDPDGRYEIAPGWGGAQGIVFEGNRYFGRNLDLPPDAKAVADSSSHPANLNWDEPVFDTAHPKDFPEFLARRRKWMMELFTVQFGHWPRI